MSMGGHLNLDGKMLYLDGGTLNLDGGMRPLASPYNLSTGCTHQTCVCKKCFVKVHMCTFCAQNLVLYPFSFASEDWSSQSNCNFDFIYEVALARKQGKTFDL